MSGHIGEARPVKPFSAVGGLSPARELFEFENGVDLRTRGGELILRDWKIYGGAHAQRFASVADHGLLDGAVILNPFKPGGVPDTREMYGSGVRHKIFVAVKIERENGVADATECIEAARNLRGRSEL